MYSVLLNNGAPVLCENAKTHTPIFNAAKSGSICIIKKLVLQGADVNKKCTWGKTPLFHAKDYKTAMLLLNCGADPHKTIPFTNKKGRLEKRTAIEHLMEKNPDAAKAIFDRCLRKEQRLKDTLYIDFSIFSKSKNDDLSILQFIGKKALNVNNYKKDCPILGHILVKMFLYLKYQTIWPIFLLLHHLFRIIFPVIVTVTGFTYVQMLSCSSVEEEASCFNFSFPFLLIWDKFGQKGCHIYDMHNQQRTRSYNNISIDFTCFKGKLKTTNDSIFVLESLCKAMEDSTGGGGCWNLSWLYVVTWIVLFMYFAKELIEFIDEKSGYFSFMENWIAILVIAITGTFMISSNYNSTMALHSSSWMILLVGIDLFLYCGIFDNPLSDFIFISINVGKPLIVCLISYLPIFVAFAASFHIALNENPMFSGLGSFFKVISMMFEHEYENNFEATEVTKFGGLNYTAQLMCILYLVLVTLLISNLLIAVSISKTNIKELRRKSKIMRTKRQLYEFLVFADLRKKIFNKIITSALDPIAHKVKKISTRFK